MTAAAVSLLRVRARAVSLPVAATLAALASVSFAVRSLAAVARPTPVYLPDEYLYAELARSLAAGGPPAVRGGAAHFPALLEPILTAPFWLAADPELAYRLTQLLHALAISLAVVPVYLLARAVGVRTGWALACAAVAVTAPGGVYASYVLADAVAYPLALTAVLLGVRALVRTSLRAQLAFLGTAGLATFARVQYAVLLLAFLAAALVLERASPATVLRRFWPVVGVVGAVPAVLAAIGAGTALGAYWTAAVGGVDPLGLASWLPPNAMLLAYAVGWIAAPAALVGLAAALVRPRTRSERAFGALVAALAGGLALAAAAIAELDAERFQERYLIALAPLAAVAAATVPTRGRTSRLAAAGLALVLLVVAVRVPLSGYTAGAWITDAPTLWSARYLERLVGAGDGALAFAIAAGALGLLAAAAALWPRRLASAALLAGVVSTAALSGGASAQDGWNSRRVAAAVYPAGVRWVDAWGLDRVALLQPPRSSRQHALGHLFWNTSVTDVLVLDGAPPPDAYAVEDVAVDARGRLRSAGEPLTRPLLVDETAAVVELTGGPPLARAGAFTLRRPGRLSLLALGRYHDGRLAPTGTIGLWPGPSGRTRGVLSLRLRSLAALPSVRLRFSARGLVREVALGPGAVVELRLAVDAAGPFTLEWTASSAAFDAGRTVAALASRPAFARSSPRQA